MMDRRTPTVSEIVRKTVEIADPEDVDDVLGRLERQFEDDDQPVTTVDNLEERLAIALEGVDYEAENPAVSVASAVILYLAAHPDELDAREPGAVVRRAVKAQWRGQAPDAVERWLAGS
jgi:hypothetical protein